MIHENTNTNVNPLTIYSEQYREMVNTIPRGPQLRISESVEVKFRGWLATQQICDTHRMCQINAHYDRRIDELVRNDVFTPNMRTIWTLTEPYVGMRSTEPQIIQARETHKSLKKIIHYIKEKLCKIVFVDELRARREQERERVRQEREAEEAESQRAIAFANRVGINTVNINRPNRITVRYVIENSRVVSREVRYRAPPPHRPPFVHNIENSLCIITEEEADKEMEDDCAICAFKHKMADVCAINCGHQFGMDCLTHWNNIRINARRHPICPYCRTQITKIDKNSIAPIDSVNLTTV